MYKMYNGDLPVNPEKPDTWPGNGGHTEVSTAQECLDIFDKCFAESRFPGEHSRFQSAFSDDSVLLQVIHDCASMNSFTIYKVVDGWLMVNVDGWIAGFVRNSWSADAEWHHARGVAFI